jgi:toxin-antitoxin system PIN domain toxin
MSFSVDANILVYASDEGSPVQARAMNFLRECAEGSDLFCLAWPTIMAYLRIATHPSIFKRPLTPGMALANIERLLALPHVRALGEEDGFWERYRTVAQASPPRGNQVPDTHLAALLRQHGVNTLFTRDRDFLRFGFLQVIDPLADEVHDAPRRRA